MVRFADSVQIFVDNSPHRLRRKRPSPLVKEDSTLFLNFLRKHITICLHNLKQLWCCNLKYTLFSALPLMFTGLRLGELCGLRWENVDMESRSFLVCETRNRLPNHDESIVASTTVKTTPTTKTDNSRRRVFIMDELFHDFEMYRSIQMSIKEQDYSYNPEGYVFCQENGSPYEPRTYQDLFKRCIRQAGIPDANFHSLRHTFATRSLEQGMDVVTLSRLLGHANPSITLDKYGHALDDHKRVSIAKLGDIYSAKPEQKESVPAPEEEPIPMEMKMGW